MNLARMVPVLIMTGGIAVGVRYGQALYQDVVENVKILVTGIELSRIADEIRYHHVTCQTLPPVEPPDEFSAFLRDSLSPQFLERDVALDYWEEPYRIENDEEDLVVLSTGPDRERTFCAHGRKEADAPAPEEGEAPPDDICATVRLEK